MNDASQREEQRPLKVDAPKGILSRHPKFAILIIAGTFYLVLVGMCAFVAVLLWRG